jgi:predicted ATPase/class 3 adenylate cyclase
VRGELPTGTVTFLFTDIEGSTRLLHSLGAEAYAEALAEHRRLFRDAVGEHGGVEVDTQGDAFFVAFATPGAAAASAVAAREALASGPVRVRMGLHTGTPTVAGEGYVGVDVHRGARIAGLAHGEQILVSQSTAALLDGVELVDVGAHRLKDFEGATRLFQLGDGDFPPLRTPGSIDLPTPPTRFLGRERELFEAVAIVYDHDPHVLTILGPGGTGKTRFAIELARLLADEAEGGTVFVPLAPLRDPSLVLPAIAERVGAGSADVRAVVARVGERTHVVVDNVEHLLPEAARPLAELAASAPLLRLLVTSREALRVQGEHEFDLPPLVEGEAVELFLARAGAVRPDVQRTAAVTEVCRRLDRLPLAIELAAARTKVLTPEVLLDRLGERLDLLRGTRDVDPRHETLRTAISWSYDLLDEDERRLFARLSVFAAGCTLDNAEAVCDAKLADLESLVDKSLVRRRTGRLGEDRFWMLETIRELASERLEDSGEAEDLRRRHAETVLAVARSTHLSEDDPVPGEISLALAEREDLRAALDWAAAADVELALEIAVALESFWNAHAPHEGMRRMGHLLQSSDVIAPELRAKALRVYAGATDLTGDHAAGEQLNEESLSLYRELGDDRGIASLEHRLAVSALWRQDYERARELAQDSLERARGRFPHTEAPNYWVLGQLQLADGDLDGAIEMTRRSAEMARDMGWKWWQSGQLHELLMLALRRGDVDEAEERGRDALRIEREQENRRWALYTLAGLAQTALRRGELQRAGVLWGAVESEAARAGYTNWENERAQRAGTLVDETQAPFLAARERGSQLDLWDAAAIALDEDDQTVP